MFARRRSSLSLVKLPCLNIASLMCYLFVVGHVSSMSLDRLGRQHQQQNDKQLEFSEFLLPEAESEMLQNDMELVPAFDANSDMYLLLPATAANQEKNTQSLTEHSEFQNSSNFERNSDMLMMESEDTPVVQILSLPEDKLLAKVDDSMIDTLAEAAEEIENEIDTELIDSEDNNKKNHLFEAVNTKQDEEISSSNEVSVEHKDSEIEFADGIMQGQVLEMNNPEQEMIGVVMEEYSEAPTVGNSQRIEQIDESLQMNLQSEDSEIQQTEKLSQQPQENVNKIEDNSIELVQSEAEEKKLAEPDTGEDEISQGEEYQTAIVNETQKEETNKEMHDEIEVENEIYTENQEVDQNSSVENTQVDAETEGTTAYAVSADDLQSDQNQADINLAEKIQAEQIKADSEAQMTLHKADNEEVIKEFMQENESNASTESDNFEKSEPVKETENIKKPSNVVADEQTALKNKIQDIESTLSSTNSLSGDELQNAKDFNKDKEKITPASVSHVENDIKQQVDGVHLINAVQAIDENQQNEEFHPVEHTQQPEVYHEEVEQAESIVPNTEQTEALEGEESSTEEYTDVEESQGNETAQPVKQMQSGEESQDFAEAQSETSEEVQEFEDLKLKEEEKETVFAQNSQTAQTQFVEDVQAEQTQFIEDAEKEFDTDFRPDEVIQSDNLKVFVDHSAQQEPVTEDKNQIPAEDMETVEPEAADVADLKPFEESNSVDENQLITPAVETESLLEETNANENEQFLGQQSENEEFANEQQEAAPVEAKPVDISAEEFYTNDQATTIQSIELVTENTLQNIAPVEDNQNEELLEATTENQKPLKTKDTDNENKNDKTSESEPIKEATSMLTTIVQGPTKEQLQVQHEHETVSSATLKPLNVVDSLLNYVNASFTTNQMSNDSNNNNKQDISEKEQAFSSKLRRYDGAQVWRIVVQNDKERKLADELQTKFDGQLWKEVKQEVDYLLKPQVLADAEHHVRAANLTRIVLIDNLQKVIEVENPSPEKIALLQNRKGYRLSWEAYHRLEDIHGFFDYLAKTYPDICSVEIIGYSIEKRPLKILKISNGNANNSGIWIDGGMHAREWISPAVVTYIANQIAEGWDELPAYLRNINWYVHAVANPDGYEYSHTTDRLWRKNMRSHGRACPGVDLNRNFGYKWGGKGTSANPCSQTYRGIKAFSEPETFYISKFISNFPRDTFKAYLSFHSYGQYILYPWGYDYHITTDMTDLDLLARQAGTIITKSTGAKFTVGSSATTLYPAAGGSDDWAKGIAGIKYSYTIEMGDTGRYGFVLPAEHIAPNGKNGMTFVQTVAKAITMGKNSRRRKLKFRKTH